MCQEVVDEGNPLVSKILDVLYATEVCSIYINTVNLYGNNNYYRRVSLHLTKWKVLPVKKTNISEFLICFISFFNPYNRMIFCKTLIVSIMINYYILTTTVLPVCAEKLFRIHMLLQESILYFTNLSYIMSYFF